MKAHSILPLLGLVLLAGCKWQETQPKPTTSVEPQQPPQSVAAPPLTVEERIAAKNAQQWDDGRVYITEHNYVTYDPDTGKPKYFVFKAKEWPREDLNNQNSYDLPRVVFRWDNARNEAKDHYDQRDKVWSIKTDGTDLRLVADEFVGIVNLMRISPNNRYLALAYSAEEGMFKVIKDLQTGEYIELGRSRGYPEFLWAEDSSYLYYVDQFKDWKYTLSSGEKQQVDTEFNEDSVIYNGKRIIASDLGVGVYDEATDKRLYGVIPDETSSVEEARFRKRSISPTGRYVWAETRKQRYLIDVENQTFQSEIKDGNVIGKFEMLEVISKNGNYARSGGAARVFLFKLNSQHQLDEYKVWKQIGTGHSATNSWLYNAFANNGDFVKGETL
ncbi:Tricorn protease domain-containing protein [Vibrio neptunius]|uniref:Tricorn protease domain-containing protein n=1 Tax=Vibrio neptunius TaxID=170651 RepID=A0ABS2ZZL9_9VIBR|nr:Tricorn protease domain-containing protein [Vibrio neptunius]MBN3492896.1 Tricorn protease domain-containing protein [Vibrio neptunius]MBN3515386.1 Tricorn protease domain-containing protein [Vibrio neptunius]MBN3549428.1 Tricorn protease domain-containing protein [Vibrio neptunius]MBN3577697.1 Tricorn protease domain-containing protein [Vibrio neptunius]MCH9871361.1 Tricorn protease domain-containing protein [Vibrio neptunius]